jgi:peptide deformylase
MARLPLVIYPDSILTTRSADVTEIDQRLVTFVEDMRETMYLSHGIGLAAPQVARNVRVITIDVPKDQGGRGFLHLINPVIVDSFGKTSYEEGCLSFPGLVVDIRRRKQLHLRAYDVDGRLLDFEADGLFAICIQHEIDHLDGVTFVDRLTPVQKKLVVKDYLRRREDELYDDNVDRILAVHGKGPTDPAAPSDDAP